LQLARRRLYLLRHCLRQNGGMGAHMRYMPFIVLMTLLVGLLFAPTYWRWLTRLINRKARSRRAAGRE